MFTFKDARAIEGPSTTIEFKSEIDDMGDYVTSYRKPNGYWEEIYYINSRTGNLVLMDMTSKFPLPTHKSKIKIDKE